MSKHVCLVPSEWSEYYTQDVLEVILKKDLSCDSISKKVEGAKINVNGVTAQLRYHDNQPWLRKVQDKRTFPNPKEYFGVYMSCNDCRKPLQVVLLKEMYLQFYNHGTIEGTAIRVECITAYLRYHAQHFWMCKDNHNGQRAPHVKEYHAFSIPCIYCDGLNLPHRR